MFIQSFYQPSKSLADRSSDDTEFDDALVDQIAWKNIRYEGSKIKSKEINKFTTKITSSNAETGIGFAFINNPGPGVGEMTVGSSGQTAFTVGGYFTSGMYENPIPSNLPGVFQVSNFIPKVVYEGDTLNPTGLNPNLKNETTALYIASTIIGGEEDPQFATIKNHSYVSIDRILLINPRTDEVQVIEKQSTDFSPFHRFITNDLPTGESFSIRLIEEFIQNNLKGPDQYKVKMNKGWLLKTLDFHFDKDAPQLTENNSMYLYKGGTVTDNFYTNGDEGGDATITTSNDNRIRFRYGMIEMIAEDFSIVDSALVYHGHHLERERIGPSFNKTTITENKFTQQYYSGSYGFINEPVQPQGTFNADFIASSGLGSASRFIGINSLDFLRENNVNPNLTEQEKTELHVTFFQGTKDFAPGSNDERSISTFEVDKNQEQLDVGDVCHDFLPKNHEIILKGNQDSRFEPSLGTYNDSFISAYMTPAIGISNGCVQINAFTPQLASSKLQLGVNADQTQDARVFVQGGFIGRVGYVGYQSSSDNEGNPNTNYGKSNLTDTSGPLSGSVSASDNLYSGSFQYQLSWLDKDHVLITNLIKENELFNGIGSKGVVIVPKNTHPKIKNNVNFYLQQAGIGGGSAPNTLTQLEPDSK